MSSNARAIPDARTPTQAIDLLGRIRRVPGHRFWADDVSPLDQDAPAFGHAVGYRQVTDAHLLTLAVRRGGRLATFDRGVVELAPGRPEVVELIA